MTDLIQINALAMMYAIGFAGVITHWFKSALNKQAPWNPIKYLLLDRPGASGSMLAAYTAAMTGLYSLGAFDVVKIEYISEAWHSGYIFKPFLHAVIEVATTGYVCDSALNRSSPTSDRRAEYEVPK